VGAARGLDARALPHLADRAPLVGPGHGVRAVAQDAPFDSLAFIGRNPGDENVYVATGDSGTCHGSRYAPDGHVVQGPANEDLVPVAEPAMAED
jgi:hypothetical protein